MKKKYYTMEEEGRNMMKIKKIDEDGLSVEDLGFILWQLEEIENFYPCYKTMIKKEE